MPKEKSAQNKFDAVMDGLLAVPYAELQKKLAEEKEQKERKKKPVKTSSSDRASHKGR